MKLYKETKECCGCGACADACPTEAVRMVKDKEGFFYPEVDGEKCIGCKKCEQVCPMKKESRTQNHNSYFGGQAKSGEIRGASSSGGIFPIFAMYVLDRQGVVFGAAYDESMEVVHKEARNGEELEHLKRTKYVQSSLGGIYRRIDSLLKDGRWVLFCGTPCQTHALRLFLKKDYPRLIAGDLVCYGAPSPGIWNSYVRYLERRYKTKVTSFSFRDKRAKDNGHTCAYVAGEKEYAGRLNDDVYCRMYFMNCSIRPSCYECGYCTTDRESDVTFGDFWGIEKVRPGMDDGMGTSLMILHTDKAREIWEQVKEAVNSFACEQEDVIQPRLAEPVRRPGIRGLFMWGYRILPFSMFAFLFMKLTTGAALCRRWMRRICRQ